MQVRVLGPIQVVDDSEHVVQVGPKERVLLARLAAGRGRAVADDVLIETLWSRPPATARKTLHGYVHRLRRVLGADAVIRDGVGYRLDGVALDLDIVNRLVSEARAAAERKDADDAVELYRRAWERFRGRALPELDDDVTTAGWRRQLDELELCIGEEMFDAELGRGHSTEVIGELEELVGRDPTRERAWCLLVIALASCGRQADALNAVSRARRALVVELGVEPGPQLRELEQAVLEQKLPAASAATRISGVGPRSMTLPGPLAASGDEVELVGRKSVWDRLEAMSRKVAQDARPRVEILVGESGVGKTRVAAEFARSAHDRGTLVLFGRCSEAVGTAYQPFYQAIEHLVRTDAPSHPTAIAQQACSLLERLSADSPSPVALGSWEADRFQLFEEIADVIEQTAADRPVLILFDDLHWAAQPTILAMIHLIRRSIRAQLAIVVTVRAPEFGGTDVIGALGTERGVRILHLDGLDLDEIRQYLAVVGADPSTVRWSADQLLARTGGNVFMLGELVRFAGGQPSSDDAVPVLVRDVIAARARRLPAPTLDFLHVASIIGLEFELDVVVNATGAPESTVVDALDFAITAQLIVEQPSRRLMYAFRHALVRDALAAGLTKARKALIHRQVGDAIERAFSERTLPILSRLAHHYLASPDEGSRTLGCTFAEQTGVSSVTAFAYEEACEWFARAIEAAQELPADPPRWCRLQLALANAATLAGEQTRARAAATEAWRTARSIGDGASEISAALLYAGEPELNVVGDEPGKVMLAATLDLGAGSSGERARVMARLGSALSYVDHDRATELALGSLIMARDGGSRADLAYAIRCRLRGWFDPDRLEERIQLADELLSIGRELGDALTETWGWRWQIITRFERGEIDAIERACAELGVLGERLHLPNQRWGAAIRLAAVRVLQGRFNDADKLIEEAGHHAQQLDNVLAAPITQAVCFTLAWLRGEIRLPAESSDLSGSFNRFLWLRRDPTDVLELIAHEPTQFVGTDIGRLESIVSIALTVREHPHPPASAAVYPFAAHDADLVATIAPGAVMYGSMHLYAGILAKGAGEPERAVDHLRRSAEMNTRIGAAPFLALTLHELAKALDEGEEARQAHNTSLRLARQIGIPWLS